MTKFQVGDFVIINKYQWKARPWRLEATECFRDFMSSLKGDDIIFDRFDDRLVNTYGVITQVINHKDAWQKGKSTNRDNVYGWYSQVDAKTHIFYENEVTGKIIK